MSHLGDRVAALLDGELDHGARDRALSHLAHCDACRAEVEGQRAVKALLRTSGSPGPSPETLSGLLSLAAPGGPLPPRARTMPLGPVVPDLPAPGRRTRGSARPDGRRSDSSRPAGRLLVGRARRARVATAGALSVAVLVLGTAFVAGGTAGSAGPLVSPVAELSVEHSRTTTGVTVGDPGVGLMASFDSPTGTGPTAPPR